MSRLILAFVLCFAFTAMVSCGGGGGNTPQASGAPGY
jgi:hypothetical protein